MLLRRMHIAPVQHPLHEKVQGNSTILEANEPYIARHDESGGYCTTFPYGGPISYRASAVQYVWMSGKDHSNPSRKRIVKHEARMEIPPGLPGC